MVTRAWLIAPVGLALALTVAGCGGTRGNDTSANAGYAYENTGVPAPTNQQVRDAQQNLQKLGFYKGPVDGIYGNDTINAVRKFQANNHLPQTGALTSDTQQHLQTAQANQNQSNNQETAQQPAPNNQPNNNPQTGAPPNNAPSNAPNNNESGSGTNNAPNNGNNKTGQ